MELVFCFRRLKGILQSLYHAHSSFDFFYNPQAGPLHTSARRCRAIMDFALEKRQALVDNNGTSINDDGFRGDTSGNFWYSEVRTFHTSLLGPLLTTPIESRDHQVGDRWWHNPLLPAMVCWRLRTREEAAQEGVETVTLPPGMERFLLRYLQADFASSLYLVINERDLSPRTTSPSIGKTTRATAWTPSFHLHPYTTLTTRCPLNMCLPRVVAKPTRPKNGLHLPQAHRRLDQRRMKKQA